MTTELKRWVIVDAQGKEQTPLDRYAPKKSFTAWNRFRRKMNLDIFIYPFIKQCEALGYRAVEKTYREVGEEKE